jgi:hypothetical protein
MISDPRLIVISLCLLTIFDNGMRLSAFDSSSRFSSQKIMGKVTQIKGALELFSLIGDGGQVVGRILPIHLALVAEIFFGKPSVR